ncbi:MAG: PEP/pyruvate-binding domain-containing protein, partial [Thermomicrobiales bacterium]
MSVAIRWFEDLTREDAAIAGGKGANLGEMVRAGLPVPPGFVVTAQAYRRYIDGAGIRDEIAGALAGLDPENSAALETAAATIQRLLRDAPAPVDLLQEIATAYRELSARAGAEAIPAAVRSSATMEDTESASFAGMNRSFLNVRGETELLAQVREVWASLYSPRVIFYRARMSLQGEPEIAVIVQQMVDADASGVAFSVDPTTGDRGVIVIEAAFGLGEVVVAGEVEPDHYDVSRETLDILGTRIGDKRVMLTRGADGASQRVDLPPARAAARVLDDDQIRAVADLVRQDDAHYGAPQDVEWAYAGDRLYLVQSRPVTTLDRVRSEVAETAPAPATPRVELVHGLPASPG